MHPIIFEAFDRLCAPLAIRGRVMEIGASPQHQTLLTMPALSLAGERTGVGLDGAAEGAGYSIRQGDAHDLSVFADGTFELVLSNSMLEHDPKFWLSLAEARRILKPGGYLAVGVPAYARMGDVPGLRLLGRLSRFPFVGSRWKEALAASQASSLTLGIHDFPGDYYRFSEQAMREVILESMEVIAVNLLGQPPRLIGVGRKPSDA